MTTEQFTSITKLHQLLDVALDDLMAVRRSSRYKIDMCYYHAYNEDAPCLVCAAGAVMVRTLNAPIKQTLWPRDFPQNVQKRLLAINELRKFDIAYAYWLLNGNWPKLSDEQATLVEAFNKTGMRDKSWFSDDSEWNRISLRTYLFRLRKFYHLLLQLDL